MEAEKEHAKKVEDLIEQLQKMNTSIESRGVGQRFVKSLY
jgi:hypothetical protein